MLSMKSPSSFTAPGAARARGGPERERFADRLAGEQAGRSDRGSEQRILDRNQLEFRPARSGQRRQHLRHQRGHRRARHHADAVSPHLPSLAAAASIRCCSRRRRPLRFRPARSRRRRPPAGASDRRADTVRPRRTPSARLGLPCPASGLAGLAYRGPALLGRRFAAEVMLAELGQPTGTTEHDNTAGPNSEVVERLPQHQPVVHTRRQDHLGVELDAVLGEATELRDDLRRGRIAQQVAPHDRDRSRGPTRRAARAGTRRCARRRAV